MSSVVEEINIIIDSPLMYIVVGIVLTFFTEWRIRKVLKSKVVREIVRQLIKSMMEKEEEEKKNSS